MFQNRVRIMVEFGDCDPANIVYFANYFRWFDRCTSALFQASGLPLQELRRAQGIMIPVVAVRARYLTPSSYGDNLNALSAVTEWGRSSFVIHHRFLRSRALVMEGWETHVWAGAHPTQPGKMKGIPVPADVREMLSAKRKKRPSEPPHGG